MGKGNSKLMIIVVSVILLLCFVLAGYGIYTKINSKTKKKSNKEENSITRVVKEVPIDVDKITDEKIIELNDSITIPGSNLALYYKDDVSIDTISDENLISYVITKYGDKNNWQKEVTKLVSKNEKLSLDKCTVDKKTLEKEIANMFNVNKKLSPEDKSEYSFLGFKVIYEMEDEKFYLTNYFVKDNSFDSYNFETECSEFNVENDSLYIYNYVVKCDTSDGLVCYNINSKTNSPFIADKKSKSTNASTIIDSKILDKGSFNISYLFNKYSDKVEKYRVEFKLGENGKYYWKSSNVVK